MQSSPRIEELRQKFHENPRRYFAPLANEYRKAGDSQQAIAICRAHLAQQPRHMSGHVVYGQALYDAGRTEEARVVFEQALALDPENVIVLRHLGDIARRSGDVQGARSWYSRALDLDPQDAEVAAYIAELTEPLISRTEDAEVPVTSENKESPIITRTLAELYLQQGHVDSALEIYRQLALREPEDPSIRGRIDELARDLEIEHSPSLEMAPATMPEPVVAPSQDDAGQEASEAESSPPEQRPAAQEPLELELMAARDESEERDETAAPSPAAFEDEPQEPVTLEAETRVLPDEEHFTEADLSSEAWDADDFWGTEAFAETGETDQIFGLPYDSEVNPEGQPANRESAAEQEGEATLSKAVASAAPREQDAEPATSPEETTSEPVTDGELMEPAPPEQASEALTDAEPQADGDAEPEPEQEAAPHVRELEPVTDAAPPAEQVAEPAMEPALPATQAAEPLIREHEPSSIAGAPTWVARITVREFFATLGSARVPSDVNGEESAQSEAVQPSPEIPAAPQPEAEPEAKTEEPAAVADDAFSRLFADSPVSPEDSRAAAALSGAVAHEPAFRSVGAHSDPRLSREPVSAAGSSEPPQESDEDLRRFREWLDGLTES